MKSISIFLPLCFAVLILFPNHSFACNEAISVFSRATNEVQKSLWLDFDLLTTPAVFFLDDVEKGPLVGVGLKPGLPGWERLDECGPRVQKAEVDFWNVRQNRVDFNFDLLGSSVFVLRLTSVTEPFNYLFRNYQNSKFKPIPVDSLPPYENVDDFNFWLLMAENHVLTQLFKHPTIERTRDYLALRAVRWRRISQKSKDYETYMERILGTADYVSVFALQKLWGPKRAQQFFLPTLTQAFDTKNFYSNLLLNRFGPSGVVTGQLLDRFAPKNWKVELQENMHSPSSLLQKYFPESRWRQNLRVGKLLIHPEIFKLQRSAQEQRKVYFQTVQNFQDQMAKIPGVFVELLGYTRSAPCPGFIIDGEPIMQTHEAVEFIRNMSTKATCDNDSVSYVFNLDPVPLGFSRQAIQFKVDEKTRLKINNQDWINLKEFAQTEQTIHFSQLLIEGPGIHLQASRSLEGEIKSKKGQVFFQMAK